MMYELRFCRGLSDPWNRCSLPGADRRLSRPPWLHNAVPRSYCWPPQHADRTVMVLNDPAVGQPGSSG